MGRCSGRACQGLKERLSQNRFCSRLSKSCAGMRSWATVSNGASSSLHSTLVSSMGMYWSGSCRCTCRAKQAGTWSTESCWYKALRRKLGRSRFCSGNW
ncbi:hypothetical protein D9M71_790240 [compost metagenome]